MASLKTQVIAFWLLLLSGSVALAVVMIVLYRNSAGAQTLEARSRTEQTCRSIAKRYSDSVPRGSASQQPNVPLMEVILRLALLETPRVEGGVWSARDGFIAYSYPTYEGGGLKLDVPEAERSHIGEVSSAAVDSAGLQTDILKGLREALVLSACPLGASRTNMAVWTMTRVPAESEGALSILRMGIAVMLVGLLSSGIWLGRILARGYEHVRRIENQLSLADARSGLADPLDTSGVEELDRIVLAINRYSDRLRIAQDRAQQLTREQAHDQRLKSLGRMMGSIAHEIRNPIAAMRLKAENALAGEAAQRDRQALHVILGQVERLDGLVRNLLAIVQPLDLHIREVSLHPWLEERAQNVSAAARARNIQVHTNAEVHTAQFDPLHLGRAMDNLLENAVRHAASVVTLSMRRKQGVEGSLAFTVVDDGAGVAESVRDHLFEPFATGRPDGTGLGLTLVREIATAHGGEVRYLPEYAGGHFELEIPWRAS